MRWMPYRQSEPARPREKLEPILDALCKRWPWIKRSLPAGLRPKRAFSGAT
jgi:hypothetical protein